MACRYFTTEWLGCVLICISFTDVNLENITGCYMTEISNQADDDQCAKGNNR